MQSLYKMSDRMLIIDRRVEITTRRQWQLNIDYIRLPY